LKCRSRCGRKAGIPCRGRKNSVIGMGGPGDIVPRPKIGGPDKKPVRGRFEALASACATRGEKP
jgi:hypothetical protein